MRQLKSFWKYFKSLKLRFKKPFLEYLFSSLDNLKQAQV